MEVVDKAVANVRRELRNAINKKLDRALVGENSQDEDPDFCLTETGPLAKRLRKKELRSV